MNYLAHLALSGEDEEMIVGNFIADFVKGKKYTAYPDGIQQGIIIHRKIDLYTDTHKDVLEGMQLISERHGKFSGILVDMYLDYFLANHFEYYHGKELAAFQNSCFAILDCYRPLFPERVQLMYKYMKKGEWLTRYKTKSGLNKSLQGLSQRIKYDNKIDSGIQDLTENEAFFEVVFTSFYPQLQSYCEKEISKLKLVR